MFKLKYLLLSIAIILLPIQGQASSISKNAFLSMAKKQIWHEAQKLAQVCFELDKHKSNKVLTQSFATCSQKLEENIDGSQLEVELTHFTDCVQMEFNHDLALSQEMLFQCDEKMAMAELEQEKPADQVLSDYANFINAGLKAHASQSSIDDVTLPLYPNSQVVSHLSNKQMTIGDINVLPAIVLATNADFDQVRHFYQQKLPRYKEFAIDNGIIFMEQAPVNFNILSHFALYTSTPHVLIEDMSSNRINNKEGKTKIEISYHD